MKRILTILPLLSLFILMPMLSSAQQSPQAKPPESSAAPSQGAGDSAHMGHDQSSGHGAGGQAQQSQDQDFAAKHDQFKADWKAMDERLNAKIETMNTAKGDKRIEAMAAVINEMADQRSKMRDMFMATHGKGGHGMGRGGRGGMMGGKGGMMGGRGGMMGGHGSQDGSSSGGMCPNCPMMQGHGGGGHGAHGGTGAPGGQGQQSGSQSGQPNTD